MFVYSYSCEGHESAEKANMQECQNQGSVVLTDDSSEDTVEFQQYGDGYDHDLAVARRICCMTLSGLPC